MFKLLIFEAIAMSSKKPVIYSKFVEYSMYVHYKYNYKLTAEQHCQWLNDGLQTTRQTCSFSSCNFSYILVLVTKNNF